MAKDNYNWWEDPNNAEMVEKISWWNHKENQGIIDLPISILNDGDYWVVSGNEQTKKYLGGLAGVCSQGKTREEAIEKFFMLIRISHEYHEDLKYKYERWVPFIKGHWNHKGGTWFTVFGFNFYFRKGKGMKGGWYIPFTNLNISFKSYWKSYKKRVQDKNK